MHTQKKFVKLNFFLSLAFIALLLLLLLVVPCQSVHCSCRQHYMMLELQRASIHF